MVFAFRFSQIRCLSVFSILLLCFSHTYANEANVQDTDELTDISQSRTWLLLLGYPDRKKSSILTESFFLAREGSHNPFNELMATLSAFSKPSIIDTPDQHPQCLFRARYYFLDKRLNLKEYRIIPQPCPGYDAFNYNGGTTSISLVFANGYFGNPASYYGHFLLKLNPAKDGITDLEKTTINFGAIFPPNENMPTYIFKGIFGGYQSKFRQQQYYEQSLNYGEIELRDVWEYELNLTRDEVELLTAHLWELLGVKYRYYFFNRNCAYRMAVVIELVLDKKLTNTKRPWQIPQHIIQQLASIEHHGMPLIKDVRYIPSRQSRLYQRYFKLVKHERDRLNKLINNNDLLESEIFEDLPLTSKHRLLDVMLDYYQYLTIREYMEEATVKKSYQTVLSKRFRLPPGISEINFESGGPPHKGRKPSYIQLGAINRDKNSGVSIKIRPAYYDTLDYASGHIKYSLLSMGELDLETRNDELIIKSLGIVKVESIQRNATGLPGDRMHSWYVNSGFINNSDDCDDCLDFLVNGGLGLSKSIGNDKLIISAFLGGGFEGDNLTEEALHTTGRILLNFTLSPSTRMRMEASNDNFIKQDYHRITYTIEGRTELTINSDVRIQVKETDELELKLAFGFYW